MADTNDKSKEASLASSVKMPNVTRVKRKAPAASSTSKEVGPDIKANPIPEVVKIVDQRKTQSQRERGSLVVDYKDPRGLGRYLTETGRIRKRQSSYSPKDYQKAVKAIKRARFLALISYVNR